MASNEERIDALEEKTTQTQAASMTMLGIVKDVDKTVTSIEAHQTIVDARLGAVEARLSAVDARVSALSQDMTNSFRQVAATMATKDDLELVRKQMEEAFKLVVGMLDERLPKQGE